MPDVKNLSIKDQTTGQSVRQENWLNSDDTPEEEINERE